MAFTVITEANKHMAAYDPIPYRFEDSDIVDGLILNYVAYLVINPVDITNINRTDIFPNLTYEITTDGYHNLKVGDTVIMYNSAYAATETIITKVISLTQFEVKGDIGDDFAFTRPTKCGKSLLYVQSPNIKGQAEYDFSNVLRDFVESEYRNWSMFPNNAVETKVRYSVLSLQYVVDDVGNGAGVIYDSGNKYAYVGKPKLYEYDIDYMVNYVKQTITENIETRFSSIYTSDNIRIEPDSKQWLLMHVDKDVVGGIDDMYARMEAFDSSGNLLGKYYYRLSFYDNPLNGDDLDLYIPGGYKDWFLADKESGGDLLVILPNVDTYHVYATKDTNENQKQFKRVKYKLTDDCSSYDLYEIIWKDRMGSYLSYPFAYKHKEILEVTRNSYYKDINGFQDNGTFEIKSYAKGTTDFFNKSKTKYTLNSGWATDEESEYLKDMFQSTDVYIKTPEGIRGCNIIGNSIEVKKKQNFDLFNYKIQVVESLQDIRL